MGNLSKILALIDEAFEENVKEAARAEWMKVTGTTAPEQAERAFIVSLKEIIDIRNRQVADVKALFED